MKSKEELLQMYFDLLKTAAVIRHPETDERHEALEFIVPGHETVVIVDKGESIDYMGGNER